MMCRLFLFVCSESMRFPFVVSLFLFLLVFLNSAPLALAQDAGITLKPATIEEPMAPGETREFTFTVKNQSGQDQIYYLGKRDIVGVNDGSVPVYADEDVEPSALDLSSWITIAADTLSVPVDGEASMSFKISVPENAAPGSHFAGIFISVDPPRMRESGAAIGYEVANIVSIRVAGDVDEKAEIRQFSTDNYIYTSPNVVFNVKIENSGNTLVRPRGPLLITNMFGKAVDGGLIFNESGAGVFPKDTREFTLEWKGEEPGFGRYEAIVNPVYGGKGAEQSISSTVTFWILPMNIIGPALAVLAVLFLIIYVGARLYVRRKLAYYSAASGGRKLVRRQGEAGTPFLLIFMVMLTVSALFFIVLLVLFS